MLELTACGPRFRKEVLGTGVAKLDTPRATQPVPVTIDKADDTYEVRFAVQTPTAMELMYRIECPGETSENTIGETWEDYRTRRIAEIRKQKERQRQAISSLGRSLGGAVLGQVGAGAQVSAPVAPRTGPDGRPVGGQAVAGGQVEAQVDGAQVGEHVGDAVARSVVDEQVQLPPGDVGAQSIVRDFRFIAKGTGACTMTVWSERQEQDIRGVVAQFAVARVIDIAAEERAKAEAAAKLRAEQLERINEAALAVRVQVGEQMVARGADPELRARLEAEYQAELQRRAAAEAAARAAREAERRRQEAAEAAARAARDAERQAKRDAERAARAARDAERQARRDAERAAREEAEERARLQRERERRERWRERHAEAIRLRAEANRRIRIALDARAALLRWCIDLGADPELQARLHAEQLRAQRAQEAEAERRRLRLVAEAEARRRRLLEIDNASLTLRVSLLGFLQTQGADPQYQARLAASLAEARARAREERDRLRAERAEARRAARELRVERRRAALEARVSLGAFLRAQGALTVAERQPPPPPIERRPPAPFEGAVWVAGRHVSIQGIWQWRPGYWKPPARGLSLPSLPSGIGIDIDIGGRGRSRPAPPRDRTRDHRRGTRDNRRTRPADRVRDHRR